MAKARIEVLGDSSSYQRAVKEAAVVTDKLQVDLRQLAISAKASAEAQVAASVRKTTRLKSEIAAYREIAAAAKIGSREQIAAAELAARAEARLGKVKPQLATTPSVAARLQVSEAVKTTEALRVEAAAYRQVAASAAAGSREQIAAANLAAKAERQLAGSIAVSGREQRALTRSAANAERTLGRATRGALAGSGVFRSLGRSIAFASGGFLAFATAGQFVRKSIDAAIEGEVSIRQLSTQLRNSGKSYADYRTQIDRANQSLSALSGFQDDELRASLTTILRTTGNVSKALRDNATAADLARARHISLAQAALIIAKTEAGNTTLLRRQGFQIAKNATSEQALAKLRSVVAGQARAGTTAQERFGAVLHNTEEIIGRGLLPALTKYLESGTLWLTQMNESGKLQKDVAATTRGIGDAFRATRELMQPIIGTFRLLGKATGGTENEIKLLGTAFLILEARAKLIRWGLISTGISEVGASAVVAQGRLATLRASLLGFNGLVATAVVAVVFRKQIAKDLFKVPGLERFANFVDSHVKVLHDLDKRAGVLPPKIAERDRQATKPQQTGLNPATRGFVQSTPTNVSGKLKFGDPTLAARTALRQTFEQAKLLNPKLTRKAFEEGQKVAQAFIDGIGKTPAGKQPQLPKVTVKGLSLQGQFNLAELRLARAELTKTGADDKAILQTEAAITRQQIAHATTLKEKTSLTQKLVGIMGQLQAASKAASDAFTLPGKLDLAAAKAGATKTSADDLAVARQTRAFITDAIRSGKLSGQKLVDAYGQLASANNAISSAEQDAAQKAKESQAKVLARLQGRQFKVLGLDPSGQAFTPNKKSLQRDLGRLSDAVSGTFLDTSKTQSVLAKIRRLLTGHFGALSKDVRSTVKQMIDDVNQQLQQSTRGPETKFQTVNTAKVLAGLGLSPTQIKAARARLSQLGAGGTVPAKGTSAFGYVVPAGDTVIHTHVQLDGREVAQSTTRHQQKRHRRNPPQKRGPHAGGGV